MTGLHDARLRRALQHAPDADSRPSAATRAAILAQAQRAIQPAAAGKNPAAAPVTAQGWGSRIAALLSLSPPRRAALASIALAGLIGVTWYGHEVPDAEPEHTRQAETVAQAAPPSLSPPQAPAAAPAPAPAPSPAPIPAQVPTQPRAPAPAPKPAPAVRLETDASASDRARAMEPKPAPSQLADRGPSTPPAAREDVAAAEAPASSPPAVAAAEQAAPSTNRQFAQPAAAAAAAPAASGAGLAETRKAAALPRDLRSAAMAAGAAAPLPLSTLEQALATWTHARITRAERVFDLARSDAATLARALAAIRVRSEAIGGPAVTRDARIELSRDGQPLGRLDLEGTRLRWLALDGSAGNYVSTDEAQVQALRGVLESLR